MSIEIMKQSVKVLQGCLDHPDADDAITALRQAIEVDEKAEPYRIEQGLYGEEVRLYLHPPTAPAQPDSIWVVKNKVVTIYCATKKIADTLLRSSSPAIGLIAFEAPVLSESTAPAQGLFTDMIAHHEAHCYQDEYADSCKYGADNCPMNRLIAPAQPLTDEQIDAVLDSPANVAYLVSSGRERMRFFARAIEAYIKGVSL